MQRRPHGLGVFQHVADVTAANAQAFRRRHGVLRRNAGVGGGQQQVPGAGVPGRGARHAVGLQPAAAVRQKDQAERRRRNHGLMVAQIRHPAAQRGVGDVQNGVQLLVARRGRHEGGVHNGAPLLRRDRLVGEHPDTFSRLQLAQYLIFHAISLSAHISACSSGFPCRSSRRGPASRARCSRGSRP